ncbi:DUF1648 domain-containing protein [Homoserinimonas hongtaonis]|uniref:DUF1648 domain-containing protein n=1 Tax=Homoserinimonas hongtaonis TaxID=2079791 RepID=UPI000D3AC062|nr:DUF1648 domain-containing protein [Salinibacterium hongtaonis]AWB89465.1 hypothetical protein C2138_07860 [Salinibacterium hongtaonis]
MTPDSTTDLARRIHNTRIRATLVGGVFPALVGFIGAAVAASWIPEVPNPAAIHWSGSGPDGFGSPWQLVFIMFVVPVGFAVFAATSTWKTTDAGLLSANQKAIAVTGPWLASIIAIGVGGSLAIQRGFADAHDVPDAGPALLLGFIVGFALAGLAWFVLPPVDRTPVAGIEPTPIVAASTERVSWTRNVSMARGGIVLVCIAILAVAAGGVVASASEPKMLPLVVGIVLVLALLLVSMSWWRVSADHRGLTVRSVAGFPKTTIPAAEIVAVRVVEVNPTADFGGWGWRWDAQGRSGVVMRKGPAIEVERRSGKRFVVTVDDAETGAAVLAGVIEHPAA